MSVAPSEAAVPTATGRVVVDRLSWRPYGRREPVLREVSLAVAPGERVLLVGPSGSGKSTLLRALAGVLGSVDAGELTGSVTVDGGAANARVGQVGLVLQEPGAGVVAATVERDVAFGLENVGMPRDAMPAVVTSALRAVDLLMRGSTSTHALSGGETQRLALAGALALAPSVLLLDEPTAMLDEATAETVRAAVDSVVAERGLTLVVVEHLLGPWVSLVDRLVVLSGDGRVVADGRPDAVLAEHGVDLAAQGIWVPGVPDPEPLELPTEVFARHTPSSTVTASPLVVARGGGARGVDAAQVALVSEAPVAPSAGGSVAVVGPSGSGKSTLLHALAGFLRPLEGSVRVDGRDPAGLTTRELAVELAWVPQWAGSTFSARTVRDEMLLTSRALGLDDTEAQGRAAVLLEALGLGPLAEADPRQLSGGEQRRLSLAAALLHRPSTLLADEPTVGQDRITWAAVVGVIRAFRVGGGAVVVATHDRAVVARADAVVALESPPRLEVGPTRRPLASRVGPLGLLGASALGIPAGILSPSWRVSLGVLAAQLLLGALALWAPREGSAPAPRGQARRLLLRLAPGLLGALGVAWSTWLLGGHSVDLAATGFLRLVLLVLPSAVLLPFLDTDRLGDALAQQVRLPARPVVALSSALDRVQSLGDTWTEISRSRQVRGLGPSARSPRAVVSHLGSLTLGLLVRTLRSAADLAVAMDARGFAKVRRRTAYRESRWRLADTVCVVLAALPVVFAVLLP